MKKKELVKNLRKAAEAMFKSGMYYRGIDTRFSCNAIHHVTSKCHFDHSHRYSEIFSPDGFTNLCVSDIEEDGRSYEERQLHQALMIDLYAEMIKSADLE